MPKQNETPPTDTAPDQQPTFVVGIGASAGGVEALTHFFEQVSADSGLAYVVILHLSPDYDSQLAQILQQVTPIPVSQVTKAIRVEANHVYVVPPDKQLQMQGGTIVVQSNARLEERRAPVDMFLRTLAESHGPLAIAVILSGTGANGSMGLKLIKERGGAVFVQNPREATFNEMPRHAIATDLVDDILPVSRIPARLLTYVQGLGRVSIPEEAPQRPEEQQQALREIFTQLRLRTGHDFSNYKRSTLLRRLERRISIHNLDSLPTYAAFLREHTEETQALLKDLLISVTNFFRDDQPFRYLEQQVLPALTQRGQESLRIWVAGCATGEEAYSLAILCAEQTMGGIDSPKVQIFATDIDEHAIAIAREGLYTLNDAADVSAERLSRFFIKEGEAYRVRREIRETILFAHQNVLKDPPFSKVDLITCRNLLIYFNHIAQERVMETFHFALNAGGYLLLGLSETVDGSGDLYATLSREHHVYQSRTVSSRPYPIPESVPQLRQLPKQSNGSASESESRATPRPSFGELHQQLLEQYAPPSIIVNEDYDILHSTSRAGRYLHFAGGEPTKNLLRLIRPELRLELRTALYQATQQKTNVEVRNLRFRLDELTERGPTETLTLHVRPALGEGDPARGFILVLFEITGDGADASAPVLTSIEPMAAQLEDEVIRVKAQLRSANEHHELQAEELKASNEELQAMNEEMRSAAEELETGKEELQSINEELITVNQELKIKVEEISVTSNNLQNLINSTDIATLFLDRSLRVNLFTPATRQLFNLIPTDFGRPLTDITNRLDDQSLFADAERVLATLQPVEREVRTTGSPAANGHTFIMRVLPYRTADDRINGVVITFIDITERKAVAEALSRNEEKYRTLFNLIDEGYCIIQMLYDADGKAVDFRYIEVNPAFKKNTGLTNATGRTIRELAPDIESKWVDIYGRVAETGESVRFEESSPALNGRTFDLYAFRVGAPAERRVAVLFTDITERKANEARQAFLLELSDALRPLDNPAEIQAVAADLLGEKLKANQAHYGETIGEFVHISHSYGDGLPPMTGKFRHQDFGKRLTEGYRAGRVQISNDTTTDPTISEAERGVLKSTHIGAYLAMPLVKNGEWVATLAVHSIEPRKWKQNEIELVEEVIERTWASVERARAEEALRRSEERTRLLIESADDFSILTLDTNGIINEWSEGARRLFGWTADEIIGQHWSIIFTPEDRVAGAPEWEMQMARQHGKAPDERYHLRKDGSRFYASGITSLIGDGSQGFVKIARDLTERKHREENQAFLADLGEDFARLSSSDEIIPVVGEKLYAYYGLSRVSFGYVNEDVAVATVVYDRHEPNLPDALGNQSMVQMLGEDFGQFVHDSRTVVVNDGGRRSGGAATRPTGAQLVAPYVSEGKWRFFINVQKSEPHRWRDDQIALLETLVPRLYLALERQRFERLRQLTLLQQTEELAKIGSWDYSQQTGQFLWSDGMYTLFGRERNHLPHPDIYLDFAVDEDKPKARQVATYLREGTGHFETDLRIRVNEQIKTLRIKSDVIGEGDQKRALGVDLDISDELAAQQQIQETAKNLQAVLDGSPAAIGLLRTIRDPADTERIIDFALAVGNRKLTQFFKQPLTELLGQSAEQFSKLLWGGQTLDLLRQVRLTGEARYDEQCLPDDAGTSAADGAPAGRWLAIATTRQDDGVLITALDITELKSIQDQQQQWLNDVEASRESVDALGELRESLRHRSELLRAVSHDLRGNFGVISGALQLLTMADSEAERTQMTEMVLRNVRQATEMLTELLDYSRLEAGQETRTIDAFDVTPLLQELVQSLRPAGQEHGLKVESNGPETLVVEGDRLHVHRMAQNLLINAIKYTHEGHITVNWGSDTEQGRWWFSVSDTGPGIDPKLVALLNTNGETMVQPTTPADRPGESTAPADRPGESTASADRPSGGWTSLRGEGIGLRIVRQLAYLLEARLDVSSQVGVGTQFVVTFPMRYD